MKKIAIKSNPFLARKFDLHLFPFIKNANNRKWVAKWLALICAVHKLDKLAKLAIVKQIWKIQPSDIKSIDWRWPHQVYETDTFVDGRKLFATRLYNRSIL